MRNAYFPDEAQVLSAVANGDSGGEDGATLIGSVRRPSLPLPLARYARPTRISASISSVFRTARITVPPATIAPRTM